MIRLEEKRLSKGDSRVEVSLSSLGDACAESSIPIYSGICHWIECLRLDSFEVDLTRQLLFITMGLWLSGADLLEPEWSLFSEMHNNFSPGELSVADFFGVSSVFILQMQCNRFMFQLSRDQPLDEELYLYSCHKRLWNALIIEDLLHFVGPANVLRKYKLTRGELAAVTKNARSQISATSIFAHHCGFEFLQTSLASLAEQLLPPKQDDLSRLPSMDRVVRRALSLEKIHSLDELLSCSGSFKLSLALHKHITPSYFLLSVASGSKKKGSLKESEKKAEQSFRGKLNELREKILSEAEEMRGQLSQGDSE